ncbi:ferrochelatase [Alkalihalobacillus oceani]|uniref:Ferrochelatase n=1 Tax=Halalkalibacter oceani TaxID=1653776 RepID=A0A9X2DP38_9BACI|nr:ferrochelatase [Halalkalibacter oceani]MCM3714046.1 ferrochelatase [Halalkalibacter oceani]
MIGILLMSYGSPESLGHVGDYVNHILNGRQAPARQLEQIDAQYRALETADPLGPFTIQQAQGLERLFQLKGRQDVVVEAGFKHAPPFIEDVISRLIERGVNSIVTLPLTPLYSKSGAEMYQQQVRRCVEQTGADINVIDIENWSTQPLFVAALANRVKSALTWLPEAARQKVEVIFTTHSRPGSTEKNVDYCQQFTALAERIAEQLQWPDWKLAYRGARPGQEWLGPSVKEVVEQAGKEGRKGIVVCDLLAVTAHVEVLHDIGGPLKAHAERFGMTFVRAEFLNDSTDFMLALATIVEEQLTVQHVF